MLDCMGHFEMVNFVGSIHIAESVVALMVLDAAWKVGPFVVEDAVVAEEP